MTAVSPGDLTGQALQVMLDLRRMDAQEPLFVRVLRVLHRSPVELSGRQAAVRLQVAPNTAIGCLEQLADLGAVVKARRGRANVWRLTPAAVAFLTARR